MRTVSTNLHIGVPIRFLPPLPPAGRPVELSESNTIVRQRLRLRVLGLGRPWAKRKCLGRKRKTERQDTHGERALHPRRSGLWLARLPELPHLALQLPHAVLDLGGAAQLLRGQERPQLKGDLGALLHELLAALSDLLELRLVIDHPANDWV